MMEKKVVFIDSNSLNSDGSCYIEKEFILFLGLKKNDEVIAFQDDDEWDGKIVYVDSHWGVQILSEARSISRERYKGQQEGFWHGYYHHKIILLQVLERCGASEDLIDHVKKKMHIG